MKIKEYEAWIRTQPCVLSGTTPSDPHHCGNYGTAKRNHDEWLVPLFRLYHTDKVCNTYRNVFRGLAPIYFKKWLEIIPVEKKNKILQQLKNQV